MRAFATDPSCHPPLLVAVDMGYGHLRAAHALADSLAADVLELDKAPLADREERASWRRARRLYEAVSRSSQIPGLRAPFGFLLDAMTAIPDLHPRRDQSAPTLSVALLERLARQGTGQGLLAALRAKHATLVTTFYAPAVIADGAGYPRVVAVVTDSDINRVWAPRNAARTTIEYCVPSERALRRLRAFGVPAERIHFTGFPLPESLVGGDDLTALRANLAARLVRLDPAGTFRAQARLEIAHFLGPLAAPAAGEAPLVTYAVGGAGAQQEVARRLLQALAVPLARGRVRLALVAGLRAEVAKAFEEWIAATGLDHLRGDGIEILHEQGFRAYYGRFNELIARTDVLWTKPSELTFYAALGVPLILSRPVGVHERANRRWVLQRGAGFKQEPVEHAWGWLSEWLQDGTLAAAAWSGYARLPKFGTVRISDVVEAVRSRR